MADQVTAMLAEQRAFASNASHELRTPLTTIRLRTEPLLTGELDPTTAQRRVDVALVEAGRAPARLTYAVPEAFGADAGGFGEDFLEIAFAEGEGAEGGQGGLLAK